MQEAVSDYNRAIAINPEYAEAYYNRGNAYSDLADKEKARLDFEQSAQIFQQ